MNGASVTVIVPTLNESMHIERCVRSARAFASRIFVVDCGSTDGTREIAAAAGAEIVERAWLGHAAQKNWALDHLPIATEWVMFLDADEFVPDALAQEIRAVTAEGRGLISADSYYVARRNVFMGRDLRRAWWYPDYQLRLFRRGAARYEEREVHEHMVATGPTRHLASDLVHESLKGVDEFLERHRRYAAAEARAMLSPRQQVVGGTLPGGKASLRRLVKTRLWYRLPMRPAIRFIWLYVVRRGFLDGRQGLVYCQLIAAYEAMIDGYLLEMRHDARP